jgi:hypothetical protein
MLRFALLIAATLNLPIHAAAAPTWSAATFVTTPDPIQARYVYTFSGCGYVPNSNVYVVAYEEGERYQEFFYGTPTGPDGCFRTPDAAWVWGPGVFDVDVLQARPGQTRLHLVLYAEVLVVGE